MSSERDICLRKADEAKQRAAEAREPSIKSAYEKVAEHWMLLATALVTLLPMHRGKRKPRACRGFKDQQGV